jgi:prepilin-type N-terminal cleavage/methylation domain-containing protein
MSTRTRTGPGRRQGFTLIETIVALALFGSLFAMVLGLFGSQIRTFSSGASQMDAAQNLRFAMSVLEKDLPVVASGVPAEQPFIVYADSTVFAYNADLFSNLPNDVSAIYVDSTLPNAMVNSLPQARRMTIPNSSFQYPDTTYRHAGSRSPAETIIFFFQRDTFATRRDTYLLWRQLNDQPPELLARNVLRASDRPFFRYLRRVPQVGGAAVLDTVPHAWLPLAHTAAIHGGPNDVGASARVDSLRAVEVSFRVTDDGPPGRERIFETRRTIMFPNAGRAVKKSCGDEPLLGSLTFTATVNTTYGVPYVDLAWTQSVDEAAGERDVRRYVLWRSTSPLTGNEDPYLSMPSGQTLYTFLDANVVPGATYYYAVAAQDCTPSLSARRTATVTVPVIP